MLIFSLLNVDTTTIVCIYEEQAIFTLSCFGSYF